MIVVKLNLMFVSVKKFMVLVKLSIMVSSVVFVKCVLKCVYRYINMLLFVISNVRMDSLVKFLLILGLIILILLKFILLLVCEIVCFSVLVCFVLLFLSLLLLFRIGVCNK